MGSGALMSSSSAAPVGGAATGSTPRLVLSARHHQEQNQRDDVHPLSERAGRTGSVEQQSQTTKISLKLIIYSSQRKTSRRPTTLEQVSSCNGEISTFLSFCLMAPALIPHLPNRKDEWEEKFDLVKGERRRHIKPVLQRDSALLSSAPCWGLC